MPSSKWSVQSLMTSCMLVTHSLLSIFLIGSRYSGSNFRIDVMRFFSDSEMASLSSQLPLSMFSLTSLTESPRKGA